MQSQSSIALALLCALAVTAGAARAETGTAVAPAAAMAPPVEPTGPLSLEAALGLALSANPELSAATNELRAVEGAVIQAGLLPNPEISTSIEDTQNRATRSTTVQLGQRLELGGKRAARIATAESGREVAAADLAARRLETRATVVGAFFDVLVAQERVQQADDLLALAGRATLTAGRRVAAGKVSPVEETRARVAEAAARIELNQARADLAVARKRLAATWGSAQARFSLAEGRTDALPGLLSDDALARRLEAAPALLRWRHEVARFTAQAELEKARRLPDVTVSVGAKRAEELGRNQAIVGFSVPFPLFDRNQGTLLEALRRADKARDELRAAELRLGADASQNQERLKALLADVRTLQQEILPGARSAYDAASKGFELGKFSFLEVLDAQRTFFQARAQYLKSLSDAHRSAADLERVLGAITLPSSVMADRP
ncbi:MAG: TolC family protein [Proteobacteria bacterium]|nr:TolC family protein [Pseudomonadota bacterium]